MPSEPFGFAELATKWRQSLSGPQLQVAIQAKF
jgi:hypothetical protein